MFVVRPSSRFLVVVLLVGIVLAVGIYLSLCCAGGSDARACLETDNWTLYHQSEKSREVFDSYSFSSDGHRFVSGGIDGKVRLYRTATGEVEAFWDTPQKAVRRAMFSPDQSRILAMGSWESQPSLALWDAKTYKLLADSSANDVSLLGISWSPDGKSLVTVDGTRSVIQVWDADSLKIVAKLEGHTDFVVEAEFSPDGKHIASISYDGTARIWDAKSLKAVAVLRKHSDRIFRMAFSPNGDHLVAGGPRTSRKGTVIVWDMRDYSFVKDLRHNFDVTAVRFSTDGRCLVTNDRHNLYAWDAANWRYLNKRSRKDYPLDMAVYSPDGRNAITMNLRDDDPYTKLFLWKRAGSP